MLHGHWFVLLSDGLWHFGWYIQAWEEEEEEREADKKNRLAKERTIWLAKLNLLVKQVCDLPLSATLF